MAQALSASSEAFFLCSIEDTHVQISQVFVGSKFPACSLWSLIVPQTHCTRHNTRLSQWTHIITHRKQLRMVRYLENGRIWTQICLASKSIFSTPTWHCPLKQMLAISISIIYCLIDGATRKFAGNWLKRGNTTQRRYRMHRVRQGGTAWDFEPWMLRQLEHCETSVTMNTGRISKHSAWTNQKYARGNFSKKERWKFLRRERERKRWGTKEKKKALERNADKCEHICGGRCFMYVTYILCVLYIHIHEW